jgi:hypothetical protein
LLGDDVDHGALHVAELSGRPDTGDLHFVDEIDTWLRSRDTTARTSRVHAVDQKLVFIGAGAERGDGRRDTT